ncbi:MAG: hypothetical protein AB7K09_23025, partial [Planctomycetota bacterium]
LDSGGMRRVWVRGLENVAKRYVIQAAGFNLGLLMRKLIGVGNMPAVMTRVSLEAKMSSDSDR